MQFIDLRDETGITQIVINDKEELKEISNELVTECVISVVGKVLERSNKNTKIPTGEIEIEESSITMLGKCKNVLPFEINDSQNTKEELRLTYRYLDLRNPAVHKIIVLRAKVLSWIRNKLSQMGFLEVQTPILTSSSPV